MPNDEFDVIVVGGGGSGLAAAYSAAQQGGRVLVMEKQPQLGGTTGIAVGSFTASGTSLQRHAKIEDSPSAHAEDAGKFAPEQIETRNNASFRQFFLDEAAATFEWLRQLGLSFYGPNPEPPNRVARMHNVVPGAKAYIAALQTGLQRLGGTILCDCSVERLVLKESRVVGVEARRQGELVEVHARRGVILAAGDYASSPELLRRYKGAEFEQIEGINPHSTGDGHRLAADAGSPLVNMDVTYGPELRFVPSAKKPFQQILPTGRFASRAMGLGMRLLPRFAKNALIKRLLVTWQHPENSLFPEGAILVNAEGRRFTNECISPDREIAVACQPGKICFIVLDGRLVERYSKWPHFISTAPDIAYAYVKDYLKLRPDVSLMAESLDGLASRSGMKTDLLRESVEGFNSYVRGAQEDTFGRCDDEHPLERKPWVLLGPAKAYFTTTEGGAVINERMQVVDASGQPIAGLFAVGQNGLNGMVLWGHGLHIAWAMTSGRLAGKEVMADGGVFGGKSDSGGPNSLDYPPE